MCWELLAPVIAAALTLLAAQLAVVLTGLIRTGDFRKFEDRSAAENARRFPIPAVDPSPAEARRRTLSPQVNAAHGATNATQAMRNHVRRAGSVTARRSEVRLSFGSGRFGGSGVVQMCFTEVSRVGGVPSRVSKTAPL